MTENEQRTFEFQKKMALVVGVWDYLELRTNPPEDDGNNITYGGYKDLESAADDIVVVRAGLLHIGFKPNEIKCLAGPKNDEFKKEFTDLIKAVKLEKTKGIDTLVFVYYAGHGVSDNYSYALLSDSVKPLLPLERLVRLVADYAYVVALFDCCREKVTLNPKPAPSLSKNCTNIILTFGCPPSATVDAFSTIAGEYFCFLREEAEDDKGGRLLLPGSMNYWNGQNGKLEHIPHVPAG